jgi:hypothetical protein
VSFTTGDLIGVAFDADNGTLTFYKNGVSQGQAFSGISGDYAMAVSCNGSNGVNSVDANFGQKPFKFPPPAGFQPLTLANTPRPTIVRPDQYVGVSTYNGNGGTQSINVGFQPDFVWIKERTTNGYNHHITDSVRGVTKRFRITTCLLNILQRIKLLHTIQMDLHWVQIVLDLLTLNVIKVVKRYVAWCWKAGGNSNTYNINGTGYSTASAAGLTAGTITPTGASVNTKSGFSIITYTGAGSGTADTPSGYNVGHGLGVAPDLIIGKRRDAANGWQVIIQPVQYPSY